MSTPIGTSGIVTTPQMGADGVMRNVPTSSVVSPYVNQPTTPSPIKTLNPVITAQPAQEDFQAKQSNFQSILEGVKNQANILAQKVNELQVKEANDKQNAQNQANVEADRKLKQQEIDNKTAALNTVKNNLNTAQNDLADKQAQQAALTKYNLTDTNQLTKDNSGNYVPAQTSEQTYQTDLKKAQDQRQSAYDDYKTQVDQIRNGTFPLSPAEQALINSTQQSFERLKLDQSQVNNAYVGTVTMAAMRHGGEYTPELTSGAIANAVSYGVSKIAELDAKAASTMADLQQKFMDKDYKMINDSYDKFTKLLDDKTNAIKEMHDSVNNYEKEQRDIKQKEIDNQVSMAGMYEDYKKATLSKGGTPMSAGDFIAAQKYKESYNSSLASERAKLAETPTDITNNPITLTGEGQSILSKTGLSIQAFNFLTQGTTALTRMTSVERNKYMNEANAFLNKNGLDYSTFASQYKAYNESLSKNILRANNTKIMAGEVSGSADSLIQVMNEKDMGSFKAANILDLMLGKEVNDQTTMKYATQLRLMANDLAGYMAAARGATSPELQDQRDAANVISNGLNQGSVQAFRDSINANEEKIAGVVNDAVNYTRKQVWSLFGVGNQYKNQDMRSPEQIVKDADTALVNFGKLSPENDKAVKALFSAYPNASSVDIYNKLKEKGYVQ